MGTSFVRENEKHQTAGYGKSSSACGSNNVQMQLRSANKKNTAAHRCDNWPLPQNGSLYLMTC
eukprot:scaffold136671_cov25-Prasinocladus_malaysianus.AAC.1